MFKVVWAAGMPRSGSMWTYNVVRELARRAGFRVLPKEAPVDDREVIAFADREIEANRDPGTVFVLKMHSRLHDVPPEDVVITNVRDIRDALLSLMRFMHVDFDKALDISRIAAATADHYLALPENKRLVLRYDELTADPAATVTRIADRIGLSVDEEEAERIAAMFSKEKVSALTERKDRLLRKARQEGRFPAGEILLDRADGVSVIMDRATGFQSGHVSDYRDGTWRHLLSQKQIGALDQAFSEWLTRHGYAR